MAETALDKQEVVAECALRGLGSGGTSECESPLRDGSNCSDTNGDIVHGAGVLPNNNMCSSFALSQCSVERDCASSKECRETTAVSADNSDLSTGDSSQDNYAMQPYTFTGKLL